MQCYRCCQRLHLETAQTTADKSRTSDISSQDAYFRLEQLLAIGNNLYNAAANEATLALAQQTFANNVSVLQTTEQPLQAVIVAPHPTVDIWA